MKIASQTYKPKDYSEGQIHEMLVTLGKYGFSPAMADLVANARSGKAKEIVKICGGNPYADLIADWEKFYCDIGIIEDFSGLAIPEKREGFDRLIVVVKGITPQKAYDLCAKLFPCCKYTSGSLDEVIVHEDRSAKDGHYAVWVRDRVEADEELANKSFNDLAKMKIPGIVLTEREILEAKYFKETGKHLDMENITLCSGSRSGGDAPRAHWDGIPREFRVDWSPLSRAHGYLRSRQVVS